MTTCCHEKIGNSRGFEFGQILLFCVEKGSRTWKSHQLHYCHYSPNCILFEKAAFTITERLNLLCSCSKLITSKLKDLFLKQLIFSCALTNNINPNAICLLKDKQFNGPPYRLRLLSTFILTFLLEIINLLHALL